MIQRVKNKLQIKVNGLDMTTAANIEVFFKQKSTDAEFKVSGSDITVDDATHITVTVNKEDAMTLDAGNCTGQIACTVDDEPKITNVFSIPVDELIWSDGYGD